MFVTSVADVLLLKDEQDPKCFTRTQEDFTCFFETADNRTYDFLYVFDRYVRHSDFIVCYIKGHLKSFKQYCGGNLNSESFKEFSF